MRMSPQQDLTWSHPPVRPLDRIIVGIDFSEMSLGTARWVGRHLGDDAILTLVHVIADPLLPNVLQWRSRHRRHGEGPFRARMESLRGALRGLAEVIGPAKTGIEVRVGDPALQLAEYADIVDADLVVVGGSSRFQAAPRDESATTDRLLRHLSRAALITRNAVAPPTTVLAVLGADVAPPVLDYAHWVGVSNGARVVPLRLSDGSASGSREQVRMILDVTREQRAEVIVIGSSAAATGVDDDLARVIARTAACSVLVVPHTARRRRGADAPATYTLAQSVGAPNEPGVVSG